MAKTTRVRYGNGHETTHKRMSKARAAKLFPGYDLEERIAVTEAIRGKIYWAEKRGDMSEAIRLRLIVAKRERMGLT